MNSIILIFNNIAKVERFPKNKLDLIKITKILIIIKILSCLKLKVEIIHFYLHTKFQIILLPNNRKLI